MFCKLTHTCLSLLFTLSLFCSFSISLSSSLAQPEFQFLLNNVFCMSVCMSHPPPEAESSALYGCYNCLLSDNHLVFLTIYRSIDFFLNHLICILLLFYNVRMSGQLPLAALSFPPFFNIVKFS